jgi:small conductance mechanosensitive channel
MEAQDVVEEGLNPALEKIEQLYDGFLAGLPLLAIALVVGVVGLVVALALASTAQRALVRRADDSAAAGLLARLVRIGAVVGVILLVLAILGVEIAPALAGLGIAGFGLAFALQGILENLFAGIILLIRKPFRAGDQIRTNDFEGTVADLDLRVTKLVDYDGELILIPNVQVYTAPLINLTRRGKRRTRVVVGVDYRDDHDDAREVIRSAVAAVDGVLDDPPVEILLCELGESSVNFEVRYWTLPDIGSVRQTQDRVLAAAKRGIQDAGMTIPWPIRTLVLDTPVRLEPPR